MMSRPVKTYRSTSSTSQGNNILPFIGWTSGEGADMKVDNNFLQKTWLALNSNPLLTEDYLI
jgi:hypothetical protein